ncbi:hypothetical protein FG386_001334 [Cryptosporidium ryanae]|uniref:uncharacterized protein n=1 Tax=Cryptosporidium ryanae TaxID=515981 RepID=UPI00351A251A|nr:hypothetical protein FG386_001334 [Cryptosporidium ryanae]
MLNRLYMAEKALSIIRSGYSIAYPEPQSNVKSQWDFLLQEMTWLSKDYYEERRWKMYAAKRLSLMVQNYWRKRMLNLERHVSSKCSALIQSFWLGITYNIDKELVPSELEPYTMIINQINNGEDIQISPARKRLYNYCTRQMEQCIFECNKFNEILMSREKDKDKMKDSSINKSINNTIEGDIIPNSPLSIDIDQDNESCQWVIDEDLLLQLDPLVFSKTFVTSSVKESTSDTGFKLKMTDTNSSKNDTNNNNNSKITESKNKSNVGVMQNNNFVVNSNDISDLFKEFSTKRKSIGDSDDYQKSLENWADVVQVLLQGPGIINTISEYKPPNPYIDSKNLIIAPKRSIMDIEDISLLMSLFVLSTDSLPAFVNRNITSSPSSLVYRASSGMMSGSSHDSIGNDFGPESKKRNRRRAASSSKKVSNTTTQVPTSTSTVVPHITTGNVVTHSDQNVYDILAYADTWDLSEDMLLVYFVSKYTSFDSACIINNKHPPTTNWNLIALSHNYFFSTLYGRMKTARQCQDRWNYLYKGEDDKNKENDDFSKEKDLNGYEGSKNVADENKTNKNEETENINSICDQNTNRIANENNSEDNSEVYEHSNVSCNDINTNVKHSNNADNDTNENSDTSNPTNTNVKSEKKDKPTISRSDIDKILNMKKRIGYIYTDSKYYDFSDSLFNHIKEFALNLKKRSRCVDHTDKDVEMEQVHVSDLKGNVDSVDEDMNEKCHSPKSSSSPTTVNEKDLIVIKSNTDNETKNVSNINKSDTKVKLYSKATVNIDNKQLKPTKLIPQLSLSDIINNFKKDSKFSKKESSSKNIKNGNSDMHKSDTEGSGGSNTSNHVKKDSVNGNNNVGNEKHEKSTVDNENNVKEEDSLGSKVNWEIPFDVVSSYKREQLHILSSIVSKFGANMKKRSLQNQQFQDSFQITSYIQTIKQNYGPNILQDGVLPPHQSHANLVAHVNQMLNQHIESTMISKNNCDNSNNSTNMNNNGNYSGNNSYENNTNNSNCNHNKNNGNNDIATDNNYNCNLNNNSNVIDNNNNNNNNNSNSTLIGANDNSMTSKGNVVTASVVGSDVSNNKSVVNNSVNSINKDNLNNSNSIVNNVSANNNISQQLFSNPTLMNNKNPVNNNMPSTKPIGSNSNNDNKKICSSGSMINNNDIDNSNMNINSNSDNNNSNFNNESSTGSMSHPPNQTPLPSGIPAHLLAPGNLPPATTVEEYLSRLPGIDIQLKLIDYTLERYRQSTMGGRYGGTGMLMSTSPTCRKPQLPEFLLRSVVSNVSNQNTSGSQQQSQHSGMIKTQNQGAGGNGVLGGGMGVVNSGGIGAQGGLIIGHGENQQMSYTPPITGNGGNGSRHGQIVIQNNQVVNKVVKKREVSQKQVPSQNSNVKRRKANMAVQNNSNVNVNNNVTSNMGVNMQPNQLQQKHMQNQQLNNTQNQQQYQHKLPQQQGAQCGNTASHHHKEGLRQIQFQQSAKQGQVMYQQPRQQNIHPQSPSTQQAPHLLGNIGNLASHNLQVKSQQHQQNQSIRSNGNIQYGVGGLIQQPHLVNGTMQSRIQGDITASGGMNNNNTSSGNITGSHHHPGINASISGNIHSSNSKIGVNVSGVSSNSNIGNSNITSGSSGNGNMMNSGKHNIITQGMNNEGIFMKQMTSNGNLMAKSGDIQSMNTTGPNVNLMTNGHAGAGNTMGGNVGVIGMGRGGVIGVARGGLGGAMSSNDSTVSHSSVNSQPRVNQYQSSSQSSILSMNGSSRAIYGSESLSMETWNAGNNNSGNSSSGDIGVYNQMVSVNVGDYSNVKVNKQCYNNVPSGGKGNLNNAANCIGMQNNVNINNGSNSLMVETGPVGSINNNGRMGIVATGLGQNMNKNDVNLNGIGNMNKNGNIAE